MANFSVRILAYHNQDNLLLVYYYPYRPLLLEAKIAIVIGMISLVRADILVAGMLFLK